MSTDNNQPQQLTVKEAREQGYTHYCQLHNEGRWRLSEVKNLPSDKDTFFLVDKDPTFLTVSPSDIYDDLAENLANNSEVEDDDDSLGDLIRTAVDWESIAKDINLKLTSKRYYFATKIKLNP